MKITKQIIISRSVGSVSDGPIIPSIGDYGELSESIRPDIAQKAKITFTKYERLELAKKN